MKNVDGTSIKGLYIFNNHFLSDCKAQSICNYLADPDAEVIIFDNATGCDSREQVETACGLGIEDNGASVNHMSLYPNPSSTTFTVELSYATVPKNTFLTICNLNGQQLMERQITEQTTVIDVGTLPSGVYVVRLVWEKGLQAGKFVKN